VDFLSNYSKKLDLINSQEKLDIANLGKAPDLSDYQIDKEKFNKYIQSVRKSKSDTKNIFGCIQYALFPLTVIYILNMSINYDKQHDYSLLVLLLVLNIAAYLISNNIKIDELPGLPEIFPGYQKYLDEKKIFNSKLSKIHAKYYKERDELGFQNISYWKSLSGIGFEKRIEEWFVKNGFTASRTSYSNDKGIDLFVSKNNKTFIVQCKAHKKRISPFVARDLYGTFSSGRYDGAFLISLEGYTKGVIEFVESLPIALISLEEIVRLEQNSDYWKYIMRKFD